MKKNKIQFVLGPFIVLTFFGLYYIKQSIAKKNQIKLMNQVYGFYLKETTNETGIKFIHHKPISNSTLDNVSPWLDSDGASLAVADINNDGYQDVFFNDSSPRNEHALFINNGHGHFVNKFSEFRLNKMTYPNPVTRAIFFDCNNDGYPDLFLLSSCPQLFINRGGKFFEDFSKQSGIQQNCSHIGYAANAFDYDKDGNLDLIWATYFDKDIINDKKNTIGILPDNFLDSKNNAQIYLMKGDGTCHFTDQSNLIPTNKLHGWFYDVGIQDIFQNGNQDLFISADAGINNVLMQVPSENKWVDRSNLLDKPGISRNGMGASFADINHDNISNIYSTSIFEKREKVSGNLFWTFNKNKNEFSELSNEYNIASCGWAWGAQFLDLNNDSWDDLVVVNGMVGDGSKISYWYNLTVLDAAGKKLMSDIKNWPNMNNYDLDGGQRDHIFLNQGKHKPFIDVTASTIFDQDKKNGRGIAYIDINNDGNYSLIVVNQDDVSHIYKVIPTKPFNWIGLSLIGHKNNSAAVGAKIFWKLSDGSESFKEMRPIQGVAAQNDPRFRLAFPTHLKLTELKILWLDGKKEVLDLNSLKFNNYNIIRKDQ